MPKALSLEGREFVRLTVIKRVENDRSGKTQWLCKCICGEYVKVVSSSLINGRTASCGCYRRELLGNRRRIHGKTKSLEFSSWQAMKCRCNNKKSDSYKWYGARGIKVCDRWENSFENFLKDMGERPEGMSLDRIYSDGNYEPGNCRWADSKEQANNTRTNRLITYNGEIKTLARWAEELNIKPDTLSYRINNWDIEEAFTRPLRDY